MTKEFLKAVEKIYLALYNEKMIKLKSDKYGHKLYFKDETIDVLTFIPNQVRLKFSDYEGTIDKFTHVFGAIMNNSDNCCDTSDFIILTQTHSEGISDYTLSHSLEEIKAL